MEIEFLLYWVEEYPSTAKVIAIMVIFIAIILFSGFLRTLFLVMLEGCKEWCRNQQTKGEDLHV